MPSKDASREVGGNPPAFPREVEGEDAHAVWCAVALEGLRDYAPEERVQSPAYDVKPVLIAVALRRGVVERLAPKSVPAEVPDEEVVQLVWSDLVFRDLALHELGAYWRRDDVKKRLRRLMGV